MPRHTSPVPRRLGPARRAAATAGLVAAALLVGSGGYTVATSPALASAPGDRFAVADLFGGADETPRLDPAAIRRDEAQASRSDRQPLAAGLPSTSAEAQAWFDEVAESEGLIDARTAAEEAARAAAEQAAAEQAAAEQAAAEEAARVAAEQAAAEEEAARVAAEEAAAEEAARVAAEQAAAEEEAARVAAEEEEAERRAAEEAEEAEEAEAAAEEARQVSADPGSSRDIARSLIGSYGWGGDQFSCLDQLWEKESNWNHTADNPSSSAYGIPQSLPGSKMASAGSDWETNPETQIRWGLGYIEDRYGSPCSAWSHSVDNNWY